MDNSRKRAERNQFLALNRFVLGFMSGITPFAVRLRRILSAREEGQGSNMETLILVKGKITVRGNVLLLCFRVLS